MKMQLRALKTYLTCEKKVEVQEVGAFQAKNKYPFVQVKDGGTFFRCL